MVLDTLLCMTLQDTIDRSPCGNGSDPLLCKPLLDGRGTPPFAALHQRPVQLDDCLCPCVRDLARMAPGSSGLGHRPARSGCAVAIFPLVEPTFRTPHLAADILDFVPGKISRHRLLAALFLGWGHGDLLLRLTGGCQELFVLDVLAQPLPLGATVTGAPGSCGMEHGGKARCTGRLRWTSARRRSSSAASSRMR
jgi:hypothetical protein